MHAKFTEMILCMHHTSLKTMILYGFIWILVKQKRTLLTCGLHVLCVPIIAEDTLLCNHTLFVERVQLLQKTCFVYILFNCEKDYLTYRHDETSQVTSLEKPLFDLDALTGWDECRVHIRHNHLAISSHLVVQERGNSDLGRQNNTSHILSIRILSWFISLRPGVRYSCGINP